MLDWLLEKDTQIFLLLNGWGSDSWDAFWLLMSEKWVGLPLVFFFLFVFYKKVGRRQSLIFILFLALLILSTDQLANFFKYGIARPRPCHEAHLLGVLELVKARCGGAYGFFSAHAANSMAVAVFTASLIGKKVGVYGYVAIVLALLIGYSRIYIGVHYPLDVLFGFGVGAFLAFLFSSLYRRYILTN